jgi:hypothetical protein
MKTWKDYAELWEKDYDECLAGLYDEPIELVKEFLTALGNDLREPGAFSSSTFLQPEDILEIQKALSDKLEFGLITIPFVFSIKERCRPQGLHPSHFTEWLSNFPKELESMHPFKKVMLNNNAELIENAAEFKFSVIRKGEESSGLAFIASYVEAKEDLKFCSAVCYDIEFFQALVEATVAELDESFRAVHRAVIERRMDNDAAFAWYEEIEDFTIKLVRFDKYPEAISFIRNRVNELEEVREAAGSVFEVQGREDASDYGWQGHDVDFPATIKYHRAAKEFHVLCHLIEKQPSHSITFAQLKKLDPKLATSLNSRPEFKAKFGSSTKPFTVQDVRALEETLPRQSFELREDEWSSDIQRSVDNKNPQLAIAIVAGPEIIKEMKSKHCYELFEGHQYKSHPHRGGKDQLGWLRVEVSDDKSYMLVDEAQSDYEEVTSEYIVKKPRPITEKAIREDTTTRVEDNALAEGALMVLAEQVKAQGLNLKYNSYSISKMYTDKSPEEQINLRIQAIPKAEAMLLEEYKDKRAYVDKENERYGAESPENRAKALNQIMQQFPHIAMEAAVQFAKKNGIKTIYWHTKENGDELKGSEAPEVMYKDIPEQNHFKLVHDEHPLGLSGDFYKREARLKLLVIAKGLMA